MVFRNREYPLWRRAMAGAIDGVIIFIALKIKIFWLSIIAFTYLLLRDWLNDGQSYGKGFMGLRTIHIDERSEVSVSQSIMRNIHFFVFALSWKIPYSNYIIVPIFVGLVIFEFYSMIFIPSAPRLFSLWSKTTVIEDRNVEEFLD